MRAVSTTYETDDGDTYRIDADGEYDPGNPYGPIDTCSPPSGDLDVTRAVLLDERGRDVRAVPYTGKGSPFTDADRKRIEDALWDAVQTDECEDPNGDYWDDEPRLCGGED